MLSKELLEILRCPVSKQPLREANEAELEKINSCLPAEKEKLTSALLTADGKIAYPVKNGIPVLLKEEGITIAN